MADRYEVFHGMDAEQEDSLGTLTVNKQGRITRATGTIDEHSPLNAAAHFHWTIEEFLRSYTGYVVVKKGSS